MTTEGQLYISQAALREFETQSVFPTLEAFIEAMPPATRGVHILPEDVGSQLGDRYVPVSTIAAAEDKFGPLTWLHVTPSEDPVIEDESIYRVEDASHLLKQGVRDESEKGLQVRQDPYDWDSLPDHHTETRPGDSEDYERNNLYSDFNAMVADWAVDRHPVTLSYTPGARVAAVWTDIVSRLNPSVVKGSGGCQVRMTRADPKKGRWSFQVSDKSGSGKSHAVAVKAVPRGNTTSVGKLDLKIGCSCEFWKWQGPDYHASKMGYLDQKSRSDGTAPTERDPKGLNRVCKHVYAASKLFLKYQVDSTKTSSIRVASVDLSRELKAQTDAAQVIPTDPHRSLQRLETRLNTYRPASEAVKSLIHEVRDLNTEYTRNKHR